MFPHHENERAQSECACDSTFANYWMHSGGAHIEVHVALGRIGMSALDEALDERDHGIDLFPRMQALRNYLDDGEK